MRKGITRKKSRSCGVAGVLLAGGAGIYLVSPVGGEEPRRGDFGETYTRRDVFEFICKCRNSRIHLKIPFSCQYLRGKEALQSWGERIKAQQCHSGWLPGRWTGRCCHPVRRQANTRLFFFFLWCCHRKKKKRVDVLLHYRWEWRHSPARTAADARCPRGRARRRTWARWSRRRPGCWPAPRTTAAPPPCPRDRGWPPASAPSDPPTNAQYYKSLAKGSDISFCHWVGEGWVGLFFCVLKL